MSNVSGQGAQSSITPTARYYRLNPYYFLADRKIWVAVGILLVLSAFLLAIHGIALAVGFRAGSQLGYWLAIIPLASVPVVAHLLQRFDYLGERHVTIATLPANSSVWVGAPKVLGDTPALASQDPSALEALAHQACGKLGLSLSRATEITGIWQVLPSVYDAVRKHTAVVAGRDPEENLHPTIRVKVSANAGSPYCYAWALGALNIVIPLGATPANLPATYENLPGAGRVPLLQRLRALLAHELSHALLRDEPISLFADARLLSIASAVHSTASSFLALCIPVAVLLGLREAPRDVGKSDFVAVAGALLLSTVMVSLPLWTRLLYKRLRRRLGRPGPAVILSGGFLNGVLFVAAALSVRTGLFTSDARESAGTHWMIVAVVLALASQLGRLCTYLGRRQMEFMADEHAINALTYLGESHRDARRTMALVLHDVHEALARSAEPVTVVPAHAVGHNMGGRQLRGRLLQELLVSSANYFDTLGRPRMSAGSSWGRVPARLARTVARLARGLADWWRNGLLPLFSTHPTLMDRLAVVENPDLQTEQDPSVPLVYAALPLFVFPYLAQRLAGPGSATTPTSAALLFAPLLVFAYLFYLVARRPLRRASGSPSSQNAEHVGMLTFFYAAGASAAHSTNGSTGQSLMHRAWSWWRGAAGGGWNRVDHPTHFEVRKCRPTSVLGEVALVLRALFFSTAIGIALIKALELTGAKTGDVTIPLLFLKLPPLPSVGVVFGVTGLFAAWYLIARFYSLAQWHHYAGTGVLVNVWHQYVNALKASVIWGLISGLFALVLAALSVSKVLMMPATALGMANVLEVSVVGPEPYGYVTAIVVGSFLLYAISYSAVVCWWPSLPRSVSCPLGHAIMTHWHNVLRRPPEGVNRNWAWLQCPTCQRAPQARSLLVCDGDTEAPAWGKSNTGWFALLVFFAIAQFAYPVLALGGGLATLDSVGRCRMLAEGAVDEVREVAFGDCVKQGNHVVPLPGKPSQSQDGEHNDASRAPWRPLIKEGPHDIARMGSMSAILPAIGLADATARNPPVGVALGLPLTCYDWTSLLRTEVAYVEACALSEPSGNVGEAPECSSKEGSSNSCQCLWAGEKGVAVARTLRVQAALQLYGGLHVLLHRGVEEACVGDDQKYFESWHRYIEDGLAPRIIVAVANDQDPGAYFGDSADYASHTSTYELCGFLIRTAMTTPPSPEKSDLSKGIVNCFNDGRLLLRSKTAIEVQGALNFDIARQEESMPYAENVASLMNSYYRSRGLLSITRRLARLQGWLEIEGTPNKELGKIIKDGVEKYYESRPEAWATIPGAEAARPIGASNICCVAKRVARSEFDKRQDLQGICCDPGDKLVSCSTGRGTLAQDPGNKEDVQFTCATFLALSSERPARALFSPAPETTEFGACLKAGLNSRSVGLEFSTSLLSEAEESENLMIFSQCRSVVQRTRRKPGLDRERQGDPTSTPRANDGQSGDRADAGVGDASAGGDTNEANDPGAPAPDVPIAQDTWQLLAALNQVASWHRQQSDMIPEFLDGLFPEVGETWRVSK